MFPIHSRNFVTVINMTLFNILLIVLPAGILNYSYSACIIMNKIDHLYNIIIIIAKLLLTSCLFILDVELFMQCTGMYVVCEST